MPKLLNNSNPQSTILALASTGVVLACLLGILVGSQKQVAKQPLPVILSSALRISETRCAECHSDITDDFALAPHSRTLQRVSNPELLKNFAGREFQHPNSKNIFKYQHSGDELTVHTSAYGRDLPIDWIFGSGTHARTPLMTWTDLDGNTSGLEHCVSWYPGDELGVTLGMENLKDQVGIFALGAPRSPAETINCFGCHSTFIPTRAKKIHFDKIEPGIGCVRCHWNANQHADEMEHDWESTIEKISRLTPTESVDRCGECHRRADEMDGPILASDDSLPRFASVGLVQSPCFKQQADVTLADGTIARLDCTSCHDPHQPASHDWKVHTAVCLNCHDAGHDRAIDCTQATRKDNCLTCHMPKLPANEYLNFTDHWIRVREE
jgi:hypothetical protein